MKKDTIKPEQPLYLSSVETDKKIVSASLKAVECKYPISKISGIQKNKIRLDLSLFNGLKPYLNVVFVDAVQITNGNTMSFLTTLNINSLVQIMGNNYVREESIHEWEFVGLADLQKDYGHVYIRPETMADKINEMFNQKEIDFREDKDFSSKYYVLASDEQKFRNEVTKEFLAAITKQDGLEIEINGKVLLARLCKRVSVNTAKVLADLLVDLGHAI